LLGVVAVFVFIFPLLAWGWAGNDVHSLTTITGSNWLPKEQEKGAYKGERLFNETIGGYERWD